MQSGKVQHCSVVVPKAAPSQMRDTLPASPAPADMDVGSLYHARQTAWLIEHSVSSDPGVGTIRQYVSPQGMCHIVCRNACIQTCWCTRHMSEYFPTCTVSQQLDHKVPRPTSQHMPSRIPEDKRTRFVIYSVSKQTRLSITCQNKASQHVRSCEDTYQIFLGLCACLGPNNSFFT